MFMASSGGLKAAELFQGRDAILSGPAGGVVGMAETARLAGFEKVIGFDMGGTSTDVSHFAGEYERSFETEVAGVRMRVPMMRIHTVAAGGGSILFTTARASASARSRPAPIPGPNATAAAGRSPSPTPTSWSASCVAATSSRRSSEPQPRPAARRGGGARARSRSWRARSATAAAPEEVADGFIRIAVENMANAIKKISVQRGYDVTEYALNCFGGAGGQHACLIADTLGMETVLIHPLSGLLSAYGMGLADIRASREQSVEAPLERRALAGARRDRRDGSAKTPRREVAGQGVPAADIAVTCARTSATTAPTRRCSSLLGDADAMRDAFEAMHRQRFGFVSPEKRVIGFVGAGGEGSGWEAVLGRGGRRRREVRASRTLHD